MNRIFISAKSDIKLHKLISESIKKIKKYKKVGLITTIQHLHILPKLEKQLSARKFKVLIGGQVLGCNIKNAKKIEKKIDAFVYFGSGMFHPLAVAYATNKPVFVIDYVLNNVVQISKEERDKYLQKKIIGRELAKQATTYGILVSTKPGQENLKTALQIKKKLEQKGKEAILFLGDSIFPQEEPNFLQIECWINTACPRIIEDAWEKNIVNIDDF
ncbi:MAG: hypothetical protein COW47_01565 [Candidatus Huberarchaeum crystalense]|uniref:2-(3-amino-3-carboxypropyl)histidine synthase n=1 Tax=Huberarchaeum crystalense TaxID=2014257 RepID=A0A2G9LJ24_HUBC1|nr:hypothetical protein [archaeon]OIP20830.1 MAG: hypothetical protein AUJ91_00070 [archaeon CG2_30_31_98]PIN66521.1 MAG: hypothetical protein COW69_01770 [Candidatus Huberarchaeum crystalense]NCS98205.1 hypothetical protein [archaeon]PIV13704.1 MAG: hypothetical protein COS45_01440 [Candidatus Huberarchaeum crystalense]